MVVTGEPLMILANDVFVALKVFQVYHSIMVSDDI